MFLLHDFTNKNIAETVLKVIVKALHVINYCYMDFIQKILLQKALPDLISFPATGE